MEMGSNLAQVALALAAIIGLVLICGYAARRLMGGVQGSGGNAIHIVAVRSLGTRERLVLVEVGGEVTLLGVTQNTITALREVPPAVAQDLPAAPSFSEALGRLMHKGQ